MRAHPDIPAVYRGQSAGATDSCDHEVSLNLRRKFQIWELSLAGTQPIAGPPSFGDTTKLFWILETKLQLGGNTRGCSPGGPPLSYPKGGHPIRDTTRHLLTLEKNFKLGSRHLWRLTGSPHLHMSIAVPFQRGLPIRVTTLCFWT